MAERNKTVSTTKTNSFSTDSFGLGSLGDSLSSILGGGGGTEDCGSRPICFDGGATCQAKQEAYSNCVNNSINANTKLSTNKMIIFSAAAVLIVVLIIVVLIIVRKK